jgi:hypothetical protein
MKHDATYLIGVLKAIRYGLGGIAALVLSRPPSVVILIDGEKLYTVERSLSDIAIDVVVHLPIIALFNLVLFWPEIRARARWRPKKP